MLQQDQRVGRHVRVEQRAMPIIPLAGVERQPVTHRGERLRAAGKDLREQTLRADG